MAGLASGRLGISTLNCIIRLTSINHFCRRGLTGSGGVSLLYPTSIIGVRHRVTISALALSANRIVSASLIVTTSNTRSGAYGDVGVRDRGSSFRRITVVTGVAASVRPRNGTFRHFARRKPLTLLPVSGKHDSLI